MDDFLLPEPLSVRDQTPEGSPVALPPSVSIGRLLRDAHVAFNRFFTLRLASHGISYGQFQHLQHLWGRDGITQVELASRIGIQPAVSTAILLSLEEMGCIRRVRSESDRRKVHLYCASRGLALQEPLEACVRDVNAVARTGLSNEAVETLTTVMNRIIANVKAEANPTVAAGVQ